MNIFDFDDLKKNTLTAYLNLNLFLGAAEGKAGYGHSREGHSK